MTEEELEKIERGDDTFVSDAIVSLVTFAVMMVLIIMAITIGVAR